MSEAAPQTASDAGHPSFPQPERARLSSLWGRGKRLLRTGASSPRLLTVLSLASFAAGCGAPDADTDTTAKGRGAIIGGEAAKGDPAVVMLVSYPPDHSTFDTCTASVIAESVLLTAAHCVDAKSHPGYGFGVFLGPDASAFTTANTLIPQLAAVKEVHGHPDYDPAPPFTADIGVVVLEAPVDIAPLPVNRAPLAADVAGQPARIVGYGQLTYKQYNAVRHQAVTQVASLDSGDTITVGDKDHRSCVGDSGGPALVAQGGVERIVGVDSYTDLAGCLDPAHYRRPDMYTAFLDVYAPPPVGGTGGSGGGTSSTGAAGGDDSSSTSGPGGGCAVAAGAPAGAPPRERAAGWLLGLLGVAGALAARRGKGTETRSFGPR